MVSGDTVRQDQSATRVGKATSVACAGA